MWRDRGFFCYLIVVSFLLSPCTSEWKPKACNAQEIITSCGELERCVMSSKPNGTSWCQCLRGYELLDGKCVQVPTTEKVPTSTTRPENKSSSGGSSVAAGLIILTFLVILGAFVYIGARRYKWLQRFRQYRQNRYGNVLVTRDDTDDDDPPIS
ncbi:uncharacterized protein LOC122500896 [Leptopilina heterotoma]|uniref:uncharacterized protein LOC122500896 n=1 Tax=Leptopilina heterotoma TaxID=63436 RepID=UPI001CA9CECE|nr:uncharacterized protein LOC122500896 [Leptopilina heterotoma]